MKPRIDYQKTAPDGISALSGLENYVQRSRLEPALLELVKLRASQINGCSCCIDMHTKDARAEGESEAAPLRRRCLARNTILYGTRTRGAGLDGSGNSGEPGACPRRSLRVCSSTFQ